jgi:hypothetical protein
MRARALMIALFAAVSGIVPVAAVAGPWLPSRGEYYSEFIASRGFSDTYYDNIGTRYPLAGSQRIESRGLSFYDEIGWRKNVSLILGAPILSVTHSAPDFRYARTETGFGDLNLGLRLKLKGGATALALQTDLIAPLGYQTNTFPSLGLGKQIVRGQLLFGTGFKPLNAFVEAGAGYLWVGDTSVNPYITGSTRSGKDHDRVMGSARAGWWFGPSLLFSGHYQKVMLFGGDISPSNDFELQTVGPEIRYRVDDRLDVIVGSNHDWTGINSLHEDQFYVGMAFRQTTLNRLQGLLGTKTRP